MEFEKATPGTYRYKRLSGDHGIPMIYIKKSHMEKPPEQITFKWEYTLS
jgi:hypothetical protein